MNITLLPWRWATGYTVCALDTDERESDEERVRAKERQSVGHEVRQSMEEKEIDIRQIVEELKRWEKNSVTD